MEDPIHKFKQGDKREDGRVFWCYDKKSKNGERWVTEDYFKKSRLASIDYVKKWRKNNPEKSQLLQKKYREANKEKIKILKRNWYFKNPEKGREFFSTRRALKESLLHPDHDFGIEGVLVKQCKELNQRIGIKFEIDHIIPLSKGGWHHHTNLQVIPMTLNRRKGTKDNSALPNCWNLDYRCKISVD